MLLAQSVHTDGTNVQPGQAVPPEDNHPQAGGHLRDGYAPEYGRLDTAARYRVQDSQFEPIPLIFTPKDAPAVRPASSPRPMRLPAAVTGIRRWLGSDPVESGPGTHGEVQQGIQQQTGTQLPLEGTRLSAYRLPPQPWDAAFTAASSV